MPAVANRLLRRTAQAQLQLPRGQPVILPFTQLAFGDRVAAIAQVAPGKARLATQEPVACKLSSSYRSPADMKTGARRRPSMGNGRATQALCLSPESLRSSSARSVFSQLKLVNFSPLASTMSLGLRPK